MGPSPTPWAVAGGPRPLLPWRLAFLVIVACGLESGPAKGQDSSTLFPMPADAAASHSFRPAADIQVDVTSPQRDLSDQETLEALEGAAGQLRARLAAASHNAPSLPASQENEPAEADVNPVAPALIPAPTPESGPASDQPWHWQATQLPRTLLWQPPLANPLQPRMYVLPTTLHNDNTHDTIDTAIGATQGLIRIGPDDHSWAFQQDVFAVVLSRWADYRESVGVDYRFGFPWTFRVGNWQAKLSYEHTSTHLGDELMAWTGRPRAPHIRDEMVAALAYRFWDQVRVYGIFGYPIMATTPEGHDTTRFDWGVEWMTPHATGWWGRPFAAFDMELRADQEFTPNLTVQVGWVFRAEDEGGDLRIVLEGYNGDSMYGQFFRDHEQFVGVGLFFDF
jgi:hypothetical protein